MSKVTAPGRRQGLTTVKPHRVRSKERRGTERGRGGASGGACWGRPQREGRTAASPPRAVVDGSVYHTRPSPPAASLLPVLRAPRLVPPPLAGLFMSGRPWCTRGLFSVYPNSPGSPEALSTSYALTVPKISSSDLASTLDSRLTHPTPPHRETSSRLSAHQLLRL